MKHYFLAPKATLDGCVARNNEIGKRTYKISYLTHLESGAEIPAEKLLAVLEDDDEFALDAFLNLPGVEHVGDPWLGEKVKDHHCCHLAHFGVQPGDSVVEVARKAAQHWKIYRLRGL